MRTKSAPYGRAGSKVRLAPWIDWVASFVIHQNWGELFSGSCAVTLNKRRVNWEFLNDKDEWIANFLSVLRSRKQKAELLRRLRYSAWEKADFEQCTAIIRGRLPKPNDPIERARIFLVNNRQSFDRSGRTFSVSDVNSGIENWKCINDSIEQMSDRIRDCTILNLDYADVLKMKQVNDPRTLVYADPPYVDAEKDYYAVNKRDGFDHGALRNSLESCQASLVLSYEDHPLVRDLYSPVDGWHIKQADVTRYLGNNGKKARELLIVRKSGWARQQAGSMASPSGLRDIFGLDGESVL